MPAIVTDIRGARRICKGAQSSAPDAKRHAHRRYRRAVRLAIQAGRDVGAVRTAVLTSWDLA